MNRCAMQDFSQTNDKEGKKEASSPLAERPERNSNTDYNKQSAALQSSLSLHFTQNSSAEEAFWKNIL